MNAFTFEEKNLLCIYSGGETRQNTIAALEDMQNYLEPDETQLRNLTSSTLAKLRQMTDAEFAGLDLTPDFDLEDFADGE